MLREVDSNNYLFFGRLNSNWQSHQFGSFYAQLSSSKSFWGICSCTDKQKFLIFISAIEGRLGYHYAIAFRDICGRIKILEAETIQQCIQKALDV